MKELRDEAAKNTNTAQSRIKGQQFRLFCGYLASRGARAIAVKNITSNALIRVHEDEANFGVPI